MASKLRVKKIQRSTCGQYVIISKESMKKLNLKAQDENCRLVEIADTLRNRLIFQRVTFDEPQQKNARASVLFE